MSATAVTAPPFDVPTDIGPLFFAGAFDAILFGVLCTHMWYYYTAPKRDPTWMRVLVGVVMVAEIAHTTLVLGSVYIPLVAGFGDYEGMLYANWASMGAPVTTGVVAGLVQWFFAWRIKVLSRNKWIVSIILIFSIVQILGSIGTCIAVTRVPFSLEFYKFKQITIIWCIGAVVADVLITSTLVYYLKTRRSGIQYTDTLIKKITVMMIETNLLTFIWNIIDLILYLEITTTMHLVFNLTISKLYSLSLLVSLNARDAWKRDASVNSHGLRSATTGDIPRITNPTRGVNVSMLRSQDTKLAPQQIYIDVEAHEMIHVDDSKESRYLDGENKVRSAHTISTSTADVERGIGI